MMAVEKRTGGWAAALLGMTLAAVCATAQTPQTTPPGSGRRPDQALRERVLHRRPPESRVRGCQDLRPSKGR